jgi:hypothetical protein
LPEAGLNREAQDSPAQTVIFKLLIAWCLMALCVLETHERISEVLFGLILVLTCTGFLAGMASGRCVGPRTWLMGIAMGFLGGVPVGITIVLRGKAILRGWKIVMLLALCGGGAAGQTNLTNSSEAPNSDSTFRSTEDGWLDISGFLDQKYGFLPVVIPITEPAVGYGGAGGIMFLSKPLGQVQDGLGRPSITFVGGLGTENGTWGAMAGDMRYWLDDHLQTLVGVVYASANLDFYGIGNNPALFGNPLRYNLEPTGGMAQTKYRFGGSRVWAGLGYAFATTAVSFEAPPGTPGLPGFQNESNVGGLTPSLTYDTRDNFFTPNRGTYIEASAGVFTQALGADKPGGPAKTLPQRCK